VTPERVGATVAAAYTECGGLSFCYGQGSVFSGLTMDSDLDIVMVWDRDVPPADQRPARRLNDGAAEPIQFDLARSALDKLQVGGWPVDVAHFSRAEFDGWLRDVRSGGGWQDPAWPLPLFAVSGFAYGLMLSDVDGHARRALDELRQFPQPLVDRTRDALRTEWPSFDAELAACARRGDGWLFHDLMSTLLRHTYITWFAAHHVYCPHPKRLGQWIARFAMEADIATLERGIWQDTSLTERRTRLTATVTAVLNTAARETQP
jgi:hypothetical protein